jgi:hypothetical protein
VCLAQEKVSLKIAPKAGVYINSVQTDLENKTTVDGAEQPGQTMSMLMEMKMTIKEPDASGVRDIVAQYTRIKQSMKAGAMTMSYDSDAKDNAGNEMDAMFRPLLDAPLNIKMDRDGKITEVKGLNEMWDKLAKSSTMMGPMVASMKQMINNESMATDMDLGRSLLPANPVAQGDTYTAKPELVLPFVGKIQGDLEGKVVSLKQAAAGPEAELAIKLTMNQKTPMTTTMGAAKLVLNEVKVVQDGTVKYDPALGNIASQDFKQQMEMKMSTDVPAMDKSGKVVTKTAVMTVQTKGTVTAKLTKETAK